MADIRKFLDSTGLAALWKKIVAADEAVKTGLETKISGVETVAESILHYQSTVIRGDIKRNADAITILNGDESVEGSVKKTASTIAAEKIAAIINNAPESFDTLKEIADWIATHGTDAANLTASVEALKRLVGDTAVATQIANAIKAALEVEGVDKYALASDLTALAARVTTVEGKVKTLESASHSHDNKAVLDGVTTEKVAAWDAAEANAKSYADTEIAKIQAYTEAEVLAILTEAEKA